MCEESTESSRERAERLAELFVDHITDDKGQIMARVWENVAF